MSSPQLLLRAVWGPGTAMSCGTGDRTSQFLPMGLKASPPDRSRSRSRPSRGSATDLAPCPARTPPRTIARRVAGYSSSMAILLAKRAAK